jgi:hypothetical protein
MKRTVEIRSYNLKPGTRADFDRHMRTEALPLLQRWKMDVVAYGPSPHDDDSYYLIRAFDGLAQREAEQDAFYSSTDWRAGPREAIVSRIANYTSVVLELDPSAVEALRLTGR